MQTMKTTLRKQHHGERLSLETTQLRQLSSAVCSTLLEIPEVVMARVIALYAAVSGELSLDGVLEEAKRHKKETWLPRYNPLDKGYEMVPVKDPEKDLIPGRYGIPEPHQDHQAVEDSLRTDSGVVWCVPGVAFDSTGNRLGRGGGFYDRLLERVNGIKIGISLESQLVPAVPTSAHDIKMDMIVTEKRCLRR